MRIISGLSQFTILNYGNFLSNVFGTDKLDNGKMSIIEHYKNGMQGVDRCNRFCYKICPLAVVLEKGITAGVF